MTANAPAFKDYPYSFDQTPEKVVEQVRVITNTRKDDISEIANLINIFVTGRKVGKVPTASNDVVPEDRVGDINYTTSFLYILVDNAGTATWRRVALGSW